MNSVQSFLGDVVGGYREGILVARVFVWLVVCMVCMTAFFYSPYAKAQQFGALDYQYIKGLWRYCYYTNGKVITINSYELCPITING